MRIEKASRIEGMGIALRNAEVADAAFILSLRTDPILSKHISPVSDQLQQQTDFLLRYSQTNKAAFFVIEDEKGAPLGTVRLYDQQGSSFSWGSWIVASNAPARTGTKSALLVYYYGFDHLGFEQAHFDVRQANERVWRFHESWGAELLRETPLDRYYRLSRAMWPALKARYENLFEPQTVCVTAS